MTGDPPQSSTDSLSFRSPTPSADPDPPRPSDSSTRFSKTNDSNEGRHRAGVLQNLVDTDSPILEGSDGPPAADTDRTPPFSLSENVNSSAEVEGRRMSLPFRVGGWLTNSLRWCYGLAGLILCLAFAATIPAFQFLALGYFFEVSGRMIRRNSFAAGFVGIRKAERLASILVGTWLWLWPITLLSTWWEASFLIDPTSETTQQLRVLQIVGTVLIVGHILAAWFCGGKLQFFFWPLVAPFAFAIWTIRKLCNWSLFRWLLDQTLGRIAPRFVEDLCEVKPISDWFLPAILWRSIRQRNLWTSSRDGVWNFVAGLQLPHLFWLGLRGFAGTMVWLAVPVLIMMAAAGTVDAVAILTGLLGVVLFAFVATWLPMLQAHFAAENRFSALFEIRVARETFRRAPIRHLTTLLMIFVFALPLYLLKIEQILPELLFLPGIVFITFMLPTRLAAGWTYLAARRSTGRARLVYRWPAWGLQIPLALSFAGFVFLMRFVVWTGAGGLIDQHAFLIPAPFVESPF